MALGPAPLPAPLQAAVARGARVCTRREGDPRATRRGLPGRFPARGGADPQRGVQGARRARPLLSPEITSVAHGGGD